MVEADFEREAALLEGDRIEEGSCELSPGVHVLGTKDELR